MKIHQLSVFLENEPGRLSESCRLLASAGVNILALSLADTQQFGILRLIVKDWECAKGVLQKAGCVVKVTDVVAAEVADRPGGLAELLDVLETPHVNIEYIYAFTYRKAGRAVLIFRFEDPDAAIKLLQERGARILSSEELCQRAEA